MSGGWLISPETGPLELFSRAAHRPADGGRAAVFLDRDGVINDLVPDPITGHGESPLTVEEVRLQPGAPAAVKRLARAGYALVCVSNQPAAAKDTVPLAQLLVVHERVIELLAEQGVSLEASYLCPHHPNGVVAGLAGACACRKPEPGMLRAAAGALGLVLGDSWMVGDTDADIEAGAVAGCRTLLVRNPLSAHKRLRALSPDAVARDLAEGVSALEVN